MSLELQGISFSHPGAAPDSGRLLHGLSLSVAAGEIVGLGAPSGAGKSTLLRIAAMMTPADAGSVIIQGHEYAPGSPVPRQVHRFRATCADRWAWYCNPQDPRPIHGCALAP